MGGYADNQAESQGITPQAFGHPDGKEDPTGGADGG